ncbi:MAG: hypothetical protein KDA57_23865, partial [Planctomycetales bacterium]|nr:hypothetical protein [Planctomycetales bacterium]
MQTFHEWLRERQQQEGLWLDDDKLAQPGMSNVNPLDQPKAMSEKPKPAVSPVKTLKPKPAAKALKRMRHRIREKDHYIKSAAILIAEKATYSTDGVSEFASSPASQS